MIKFDLNRTYNLITGRKFNIFCYLFCLPAIFTACSFGGDYYFRTEAEYYAVRSNLSVTLSAKGYVPPGADTGEGKVTGTITANRITGKIIFRAESSNGLEIAYENEKTERKSIREFTSALTDILGRIGYRNFDAGEIGELGKVIVATTYGPKATYMEGQTDFIKVINVEFERN